MSAATLGPSSFIVLGLLAQRGPATSYDLKRWADQSVGYFWTFPRSQLYAEPQRLVGLGLLTEVQEESGRRKRTFHLTAAGQAALQEWLVSPAGFPELRDLGLLKLFFMLNSVEDANSPDVRQLAAEQLALHQGRLAEYQQLDPCSPAPQAHPALRGTLQMGFLYEEASIAFWSVFARQNGEE